MNINTKYQLVLLVSALIGAVTVLTTYFGHTLSIESRNDLLFESNTLFILIFIYLLITKSMFINRWVRSGLFLLILNQAYDVITEITALDEWADRNDFVHTVIEDGSLQIAYLLIAFGITRLINDMHNKATEDELTGLYNRKKLAEIELSTFDLIYFDLDGLKLVNDNEGHYAGDMLIIQFAHALKTSLPVRGNAYRIGGDEFVAIVPVGNGDALIEHLDKTIDQQRISYSYGIEPQTKREKFTEALIKTDQAMYKMKHSQRKG